MTENKKLQLLETKSNLDDNFTANIQKGQKLGTEIEKGVVLNEEYLIQHEQELRNLFQFYSAYPDLYLDTITPEGNKISLFFYQRIFLRAVMRFTDIFLTANRAFSKSFLTILGMLLQCIFIPGRKVFICAPNKTQGAQIAKEKIYEIYQHWPLIKKEVIGCELNDNPGNFGKDYVTLKFRNGSQFDVVGALESTLGGRRHGLNFLLRPNFLQSF